MSEDASQPMSKPQILTEGPFAGWSTWGCGADPYETALGPFCFREREGSIDCAFLPRRDHLNVGGTIHGGALMSFADFAFFAIANNALAGGYAVTVTCNCEFLAPGIADEIVEARGEVLRQTRSLVFVRGVITQNTRSLLAFSGTLKKIDAPRLGA